MAKFNKKEYLETLKKRWWIYLIEIFVIAVILVADQVSKSVVFENYFNSYYTGREVEIIPKLFNLICELNTGGGFSIFSGNMAALSAITTIVVVAVVIYLCTALKENEWLRVSLIFIVAGGIGNLIDRFASISGNVDYYGVRDFIQFAFWEEFPVFNIADSFVTIGSFMLIIVLIVMLVKEAKTSKEQLKKDLASKDEIAVEEAVNENGDSEEETINTSNEALEVNLNENVNVNDTNSEDISSEDQKEE